MGEVTFFEVFSFEFWFWRFLGFYFTTHSTTVAFLYCQFLFVNHLAVFCFFFLVLSLSNSCNLITKERRGASRLGETSERDGEERARRERARKRYTESNCKAESHPERYQRNQTTDNDPSTKKKQQLIIYSFPCLRSCFEPSQSSDGGQRSRWKEGGLFLLCWFCFNILYTRWYLVADFLLSLSCGFKGLERLLRNSQEMVEGI